MNAEELDDKFNEAVDKINNHQEPFPADFLLRLYAYYKKATQSNDPPRSRTPLINAFKANALFQAKNISEKEAKKKYIKLVEQYFEETKK
ncbi:acyl-CoA-binding protein [Robertkochia solimangrovi]|uniref:acyl-CoA-binding protein n=1 Tax=Robertkochia solimangrovi TaxID=2213046 RepID=UPI00117FD868|nr:acyl-CoA-binding protein [Robertkochia solimangrovi]TRZ41448.1 acyl-CoA-binding protein [Robertkochia solimangrovi]